MVSLCKIRVVYQPGPVPEAPEVEALMLVKTEEEIMQGELRAWTDRKQPTFEMTVTM